MREVNFDSDLVEMISPTTPYTLDKDLSSSVLTGAGYILEGEIQANGWLSCPADPDLVFNLAENVAPDASASSRRGKPWGPKALMLINLIFLRRG